MKHLFLALLIATVNIDDLIGNNLHSLIKTLCADTKNPKQCSVVADDCVFSEQLGDIKVIATCVKEAAK